MENERIRIKVSNEVRSLIPEYLKNRHEDITAIREFLKHGNFNGIQTIGHRMKGSGQSYGFDQITLIGEDIERAAKEKSADTVRKAEEDLSEFLGRLEVSYE